MGQNQLCGFVGKYSPSATSPSDPVLKSAMSSIAHRGPDSSGNTREITTNGTLVLGFKRLAIIDLSDSASQPFQSTDEKFTLTFNGEIYNYLELRKELITRGYKFRTDSDTEVLLAAWREWGKESLNKLIGMFSFVIHDKFENSLYCARDAFGIKPLYYCHSGDSFSFASEIEAIRIISGKKLTINNEVAQEYLIYGRYDLSQETFFDGVFSLSAGCLLKVDLKPNKIDIQTERWWNPPIKDWRDLGLADAIESLREEFLNSVRLHLRSDVKIAIALSGGLDSAAIVGAIRFLEPDLEINTFSYLADSSEINESFWIRKVNEQVQAKNHLIQISPGDFARDVDELIKAQGEPFSSTSVYAQYRVFQAVRQSGTTVLLEGQGADELFAGYYGYPEARMRSMLENHQVSEMLQFFVQWGRLPNRSRTQLLKSLLKQSENPFVRTIVSNLKLQTTAPDFFVSDFKSIPKTKDYLANEIWRGRKLHQRILQEQTSGTLSPLLRHSDRNSMHWSIESRVPFLTPGLSTLGLNVPENYLVSNSGETKHLLRLALKGIVDQEVIDRKDKIGFETPKDEWMAKLISRKSDVLDGAIDIDFLDSEKSRKFLLSESTGDSRQINLKWRLFNLIRWKQLSVLD